MEKRAKKQSGGTATVEFEPTSAYARLQADVERRRALGLSHDTTPHYFRKEPKPVGELIKPALDAMMARRGITEADVRNAEKEIERMDAEGTDELLTQRKEARWRILCPAKFREPYRVELVPESVNREKIKAVLDWIFNPIGLWIIGDTGLAKTTSVFKMLYREVIEKNRSAVIIDGIAFANGCSVAFSDSTRTEKWLREMAKPDILFIDDFAKRLTPATQTGFFAVLDRRTSNLKPIIITTNVSGQALFESRRDGGVLIEAIVNDPQLAGPMRRRLRQYCVPIIF